MSTDETDGKLLVLPGGTTEDTAVRIEVGIGRVLVLVDGPAARAAQDLATQADGFGEIDDSNFEAAGAIVAKLAGIEKRLETDRKHIKAPVLALGSAIDQAARDFVHPLAAAKDKLARKVGAHVKRKQEQRDAALAERRAAMSAPPEPATWPGPPTGPARSTVPLAPLPVVPKSPVTPRKVPVLVITDPEAVPVSIAGALIRPIDEAKLKALLKAGVQVPGAHLEEADDVTVRSR